MDKAKTENNENLTATNRKTIDIPKSSRDTLQLRSRSPFLERTGEDIAGIAGMQTAFVQDALRENEDLNSEGMRRIRDKGGGIIRGAGIIGEVSKREEIFRRIERESNAYMAGDFLFAENGTKPSKAAHYLQEHGFTVGLARAYDRVLRDPHRYMVPGTLNFAEDRVMDLILRQEEYLPAGSIPKAIIHNQKTGSENINHIPKSPSESINRIPRSARSSRSTRKKYQKFMEARQLNVFEARIRGRDYRDLFLPGEQEILVRNNGFLDIRDVADLKKRISMIDKVILMDMEHLKEEGIVFTEGSILAGLPGRKAVTVESLAHMRAHDVKDVISTIRAKRETGIPAESKAGKLLASLEEDFLQKKKLTHFREGLVRYSGRMTGITSAVMFLGGDEVMQSDMGRSVHTVAVGGRTAAAGVRTAVTGTNLALAGADRVLEAAAPEFALEIKTAAGESKRAFRNAVRKSPPVRTVRDGVRKVRTVGNAAEKGIRETRRAFLRTGPGWLADRAGSFIGAVGRNFRTMVTAPFRFLAKAADFGRRKVMTPILLVCLAVLVLNIVLASIFGAGDGASTTVVTTILAEPGQFRDYQALYDRDDHEFETTVNNRINGYAATPDLKGEPIHYGINSQKRTVSGYENKVSPGHCDISIPEQYAKGVTVNYYYDGQSTAGISSNIEDCLSAMVVLMQQNQSAHHEEALELLDALYRSTHSFNAVESPLYACAAGDYILNYRCNEYGNGYPSATLSLPAVDGSMAEVGISGTYVTADPWTSGRKLSEVLLRLEGEDMQCPVCMEEDPEHPEEWAGCTVVDSPNEYSEVETKTYELVKDSYENNKGKERIYYYQEGNEDANPSIRRLKNGHRCCFHNEGYGDLLSWDDPVDREDGKERCVSTSSAKSLFQAIKQGQDLEKYADQGWDTDIPEWARNCSELEYYEYIAPYKDTDAGMTVSGCMGIVLYCGGHNHHGCEYGHDLPVCYGHTDLTMSVNIGSLNRIFEMGGVPVRERNAN